MKVVVIPRRPIPGILPKNKWIDSKMVLDLNRNEIMHCMQYGTVYDESGRMIDSISIKNIPTSIHKELVKPVINVVVEEPVIVEVIPEPVEEFMVTPIPLVVEEPVIIEKTQEPVEESVEEPVIEVEPSYPETFKEYFILENISTKKEDEYIVLEVEMNTNSKLEGNLYGLFTVISGTRPTSLEFKVGDEWFKFSNKFANFTEIENGAKFVFRFIPKNENEFTYRLSIKSGNDVLAKLEDKVNPSEI